MAYFKIKLEDDTLLDYQAEGNLETAVNEIINANQFIHCQDYRGKNYYVNKDQIKLIYSEAE